MTIRKGKLLSEGDNKRVYLSNVADQVILNFKDSVRTGKKKSETLVKGKGVQVCSITAALFRYLESYHIPTILIDIFKPNELLVKKIELLPVKIVVWNFASGGLCKRFGLIEGDILPSPILEMYLADSKLKYPMINIDHVCAFGHSTPAEMQLVDQYARKINAVLKSYFDRRSLKLLDFMIEFGKFEDKIVLSNLFSFQTFHLWDISAHEIGKKSIEPVEPGTEENLYRDLREKICP